jgi:hypothetical protein
MQPGRKAKIVLFVIACLMAIFPPWIVREERNKASSKSVESVPSQPQSKVDDSYPLELYSQKQSSNNDVKSAVRYVGTIPGSAKLHLAVPSDWSEQKYEIRQ